MQQISLYLKSLLNCLSVFYRPLPTVPTPCDLRPFAISNVSFGALFILLRLAVRLVINACYFLSLGKIKILQESNEFRALVSNSVFV